MGAKKQIIDFKQIAEWVGSKRKVFKQFAVSLWSYLSYPFVRKNHDATRKYFSHIYRGAIQDELIFDGNSGGYLKKIEILPFAGKQYDTVFDCGCGSGSMFQFLTQNRLIAFDRYIGIDFAVQADIHLSQNARIIKENIVQYALESLGESLIVLCNVACYLSAGDLNAIIQKAKDNNCDILILDPIPGLFWDATFSNVKLYYRKVKKMQKIMGKYEFKSSIVVKDYLWHVRKWYVTPLSYATLFTYNDFTC